MQFHNFRKQLYFQTSAFQHVNYIMYSIVLVTTIQLENGCSSSAHSLWNLVSHVEIWAKFLYMNDKLNLEYSELLLCKWEKL